jgi:hypothetical protein
LGANWVNNGGHIDITRLDDGRIMCQLCFDYFPREELQEIEPGIVTDVCIPCWEEDQKAILRKFVGRT